jgi:hypothetical protein
METSENRILSHLRTDAARSAFLFSNAGQELQERTAVAGLLRTLRIDFKKNEIIKRGPEPVDVWFRDARFQVTEVLDQCRRRNQEIGQRSARIRKARRLKAEFFNAIGNAVAWIACRLNADDYRASIR